MALSVTEYRETEPYRFEAVSGTITDVPGGMSVFEPLVAAICGSDLLYFRGQKDFSKLKERLPLVLLHEGVVRSPEDGTLGVVVPLRSCGTCAVCARGETNYCPRARFMGSTAPGLARTAFVYPRELVLPLPAGVPLSVAAVAEPLAIAWHLAREVTTEGLVAVIGQGALGYLVVLMLALVQHIPRERLFIVGTRAERLAAFAPFATLLHHGSAEGEARILALARRVAVVVEAAGGGAMSASIGGALRLVETRGTVYVLGISDVPVPVPMGEVVNHGLNIRGLSRATPAGMRAVLALCGQPAIQENIERIIDPLQFEVRSPHDLLSAFHYAAAGRHRGRVLAWFKERTPAE